MLKNRAHQLSVLLIVAAVFGGGGVAYGIANLFVQLTALVILAANYEAVRDFCREAPRTLIVLLALSLALPLLQIVPLPPSIWTALPGRELVAEALAAAGKPGWFALSVNSARTFVAFVGLLAPLAVVVIGWHCRRDGLERAVRVIIGLGLLSVALGTAQVLGSGMSGSLYAENVMPGVLFGFFANRNSTAIFLVCCLILLATLPPVRPASSRGLLKAGTALLLGLGVILTQSRTGTVLMAVPLGLAVLHFASSRLAASRQGQPTSTRASRALVVIAAGAIALAAMAPLASGSRIDSLLARFENTEDQRTLIWEDAQFAAQRYWPAGAGMATFDEVFQADESLENISQRRAGRAHNDYLEMAIEAGAAGLALIAAWAVWVLAATWRAMPTQRRWPVLGGTSILLVIALQSVLDYPLRNQTMLCVAALAIVLVAPPSRRKMRAAEAEAQA